MQHPFPAPRSLRRSVLLTLLACPAALLALAEPTLSLEQARELREDTKRATDAVGAIAANAENTALSAKAADAKAALDRANGKLDAYIARLEKAAGPADPYAGGNKYPPIANVSITSFYVPLGATVVHVPVVLDKASANTVIAHIRVYDGQGGRATPDTTKSVIFRPGDALVKSVSFAVAGLTTEGNTVRAVQSIVPDGANRKGSNIVITAKAGAINAPVEDASRPPLAFSPLGEPCYAATGETIRFDDEGGQNSFSTSLAHGRTQVGNGETGYYGTLDMGGFSRSADGLVLSSRRLTKPIPIGSPAIHYPFLAAMLSGHRTPETQFRYGSVEWVVKMPNRKGAWPALWLLPVDGWPPEIDVYEGFGYNGSWRFPSSLSTNLHGGENLVRKFTRPAMSMRMSTFGLRETLDSEFHAFAVTVDPEWITMFIDGVETMRYANPFKGETWYPLTNVAVKADVNSSYDDGSGDMTLRSLKIWRSE